MKEMNEKKYQLINRTIEVDGHTLYRIQALKDFGDVKAGDIGGFVESEINLSQMGSCWIYDNAMCYEYGYVWEAGILRDNAKVHGTALVRKNSSVSCSAELQGVKLKGAVRVTENVKMIGNEVIVSPLLFRGDAVIFGRESYTIIENSITHEEYMLTFTNRMWSNENFYGTAEEMIRMGYEISEEMGQEFERMADEGDQACIYGIMK